MSFDEEHLDEHYPCQQAYAAIQAERDALAAELAAHKRLNAELEASDIRLHARIRELEAALREVMRAALASRDAP